MKFDIVDFYGTISEDLLHQSIKFAKPYTSVSDETTNIIITAAIPSSSQMMVQES